jgi:transcriptional regulator with XRE-family HTH domain
MTTRKYALREARQILELTKGQLSDLSGISISAIRDAENGGQYKTHEGVALALSDALGLEVNELEWQNGLSHIGRTPKTGRPIQVETYLLVPVCLVHWMILPSTGICDDCVS